MKWKVETVPELEGYSIEWAEPGNYYLSRQNVLFHSTDLRQPLREFGRVPAPSWRAVTSKFRLAQRLFRFFYYNVVPLANGDVFVTFDKTVGVFRNGKYIELEGLARPCRVLRSGCAVDAAGNIYFGEYLANNERDAVRIYKFPAGGTSVKPVHVFPPRSIKHIHALHFDRFSDSIFCLTGDAPAECQILRTSDGFKTVETLGSGGETWRAVSMLFTENSLFYGTDAEHRDNEIFRVDRATLDRTSLGEVTGTVFYSKQVGDDLFFGTTAENAPSQKMNVAAIWHVGHDGGLEKLIEFSKDRWHQGLFLFGTIHFPASNNREDCIYFNTVAVSGEESTRRIVRSESHDFCESS